MQLVEIGVKYYIIHISHTLIHDIVEPLKQMKAFAGFSVHSVCSLLPEVNIMSEYSQ
jgi:hypothetical protein